MPPKRDYVPNSVQRPLGSASYDLQQLSKDRDRKAAQLWSAGWDGETDSIDVENHVVLLGAKAPVCIRDDLCKRVNVGDNTVVQQGSFQSPAQYMWCFVPIGCTCADWKFRGTDFYSGVSNGNESVRYTPHYTKKKFRTVNNIPNDVRMGAVFGCKHMKRADAIMRDHYSAPIQD